jgi:hypothetical protein
MSERPGAPARFVSFVGWMFLAAAGIGLFISAGQVVVLSQAAPGFAVDRGALALAIGLASASAIVAVVSRSFLRRQRWAHTALVVISVLALIASALRLLVRTPEVEPPPNATAEYVEAMRFISMAHVVSALASCLALGVLLWMLCSAAVRDQFR